MIEDRLVTLLDDARASLIDCGSGDVCRAMVWPGEIVAFIGCGFDCADSTTCGQLWVRLVTSFTYRSFPIPEPDPTCLNMIAHQIEVGVVRCMPVGDEEPPSDDTISETALLQMRDARALRQAIAKVDGAYTLDQYTPIGPSGDCVGGSWLVSVDG